MTLPVLLLLLACSEPLAAPCHGALQPGSVTPATSDSDAAPSDDSGGSQPPACALVAWYLDCDGDGVGVSPTTLETAAVIACENDLGTPDDARCVWVSVAGDCDDTTPGIRPFLPELCDGLDNDCDARADEDCP